MSKRPSKKRSRSRIVPAAVFAASVAIGAVPALAGCGGSEPEVQDQGVAVPPPDDATSGGTGDTTGGGTGDTAGGGGPSDGSGDGQPDDHVLYGVAAPAP